MAINKDPNSLPQYMDESEADMLFSRRRKTTSWIVEEPPVPQEDQDNAVKTLDRADNAVKNLENALELAQQKAGGMTALQMAPRRQAVELGRDVSAISHLDGPILSNDDEDGSVKTWESQITETTFIKVGKEDATLLHQRSWESVASISKSLENGHEQEHDLTSEQDPPFRSIPTDVRSGGNATGAAPVRKWDKLRSTIEAEQREAKHRNEKKRSLQPFRGFGQGLRKSLGGFRRSRQSKQKLGDSEMTENKINSHRGAHNKMESRDVENHGDVDAVSGVKISVEDLSRTPASGPQSDRKQETERRRPSRKVANYDEVDESLEVVCVTSEDSTGLVDVLPPFPSKMVTS